MAEVDEAQQALMRKFAMLASLAFSVAELAQRSAARRAAEALRQSTERQREIARQIKAQRDLAAVQWARVRDSSLYKDPDALAQVWASAKVWEQLDPRAAVAVRELDRRLDKPSVDQELAKKARENDDYAAMAILLNHSEQRRRRDNDELDELTRENADAAAAVDAARDEANVERARSALGEERAEAVIESEGWAALNAALDEAAERGYSPELLLREMYNSRPLDDRDPDKARDVGAVLHWRVERHLNTNPEPEPKLSSTAYTAEQDQADAAAETARHDDPAASPVPPPLDFDVEPVDPGRLYKAGELVADTQFGSTSMLRRKMGIDFAEAERLMDALERVGVVGMADGNKAREVLIRPGEASIYLAYARDLAAASPAAEQPQRDVDDLRVAAALVTDTQFGSTSLLQRKMQIGYAEAERLMDGLEAHGIVGPAQGSAARDVLMQPDEADTALMGLVVDPLPSDNRAGGDGAVSEPEPEPMILIGQVDAGEEHVYVSKDRAAEVIAGLDPLDENHVATAQTIYGQDQQLDGLLQQRFPRELEAGAHKDQAEHGVERAAGAGARDGDVEVSAESAVEGLPADPVPAGTYETGHDVAQLAGKSYPHTIADALAASAKKRVVETQVQQAERPKPRTRQQDTQREQ